MKTHMLVPLLAFGLTLGGHVFAAGPSSAGSSSTAASVKSAPQVAMVHHKTAPQEHLLKAMGTVESINLPTNQLAVKEASGTILTLSLDKDTKTHKAGKTIDISQLKQGEHVIVRYEKATSLAKRIDLKTASSYTK